MKLKASRKRNIGAAARGLLTLVAFLAGHVAPAASADVKVVVEGLRNGKGNLLVALCGEEAFLSAKCTYTARAPADSGQATVTGVPPGTYAAQVFHDENGNGTIDHTFRFRPLEGMGFSRDAPMRRGPPKFTDAVFDLPEPSGTVRLTMRYFQ